MQTAHDIYRATEAGPTFRALIAGDLPTTISLAGDCRVGQIVSSTTTGIAYCADQPFMVGISDVFMIALWGVVIGYIFGQIARASIRKDNQ